MEEQIYALENKLRNFIDATERRLEKLEVIHTRYTGDRGPAGPKGEKGEKGDSGKPGQSADLTQFRTERNAQRDEIHDLLLSRLNDVEANFRRYEEELHRIFTEEIEAFCAMRDDAVKRLNELASRND